MKEAKKKRKTRESGKERHQQQFDKQILTQGPVALTVSGAFNCSTQFVPWVTKRPFDF